MSFGAKRDSVRGAQQDAVASAVDITSDVSAAAELLQDPLVSVQVLLELPMVDQCQTQAWP